jgi:hypothetical protein
MEGSLMLDPNIILSGENPDIVGNSLAAYAQGQESAAKDSARASQNQLSAYVAAKPKGMKLSEHLNAGGYGDQALEAQKTESGIAKDEATAQGTGLDNKRKSFEVAGKYMQDLLARPNLSKQAVADTAKEYYNSGLTDGATYQKQLATIPTMPDDPTQLREYVKSHVMALMDAQKQMQFMAPDANAKLSADTALAGQGVTMRGQDISQQNNLANQLQDKNQLDFNKGKFGQELGEEKRYHDIQGNNQTQSNQLTGRFKAADMEMKMADDHKAQSKDFISVRDGYTRLKASLPDATKSAASTLAGATSFMKLLDPGSVVRESELGMSLAATGVVDRMTNYYNTLLKGKVLTASQAKDFGDTADKIYRAAEHNQAMLNKDYEGKAKAYGLNSKNIIGNYNYNQDSVATSSWGSAGDAERTEYQKYLDSQ